MSARRDILLSVVALLVMTAAAHGELSVRLTTETASLFRYEPFTLRLEVQSDQPPEPPTVPAVPGLAVTAVRRSPEVVNARLHTFEIELIAEREGRFILPPFQVRAGGEAAMTSALSLQLRAPRPATEMDLTITVDPSDLRTGQAATVTVTWTSAVPFSRCHQLLLEIPLLAEERCQLFPIDPPVPESQRLGLPVNHLRVVGQAGSMAGGRHFLSFRYVLVPRVPCVLRTPPARLSCALLQDLRPPGEEPGYFYNQFFSAPADEEAYDRVFLAASVPEIRVRALPDSGRSSRFAEIVGPCGIRTSIVPERLVVGQPALLTVQLENLAFARQIGGLPSAAWSGLRPDFQICADPIRNGASDHARSFTHVLRPLRSGIARVPAIVIQTFNPDSGEYQTLRSEPIPVTVAPGPEGANHAVVPRLDAQAPIPLTGIRHNRIGEPAMIMFGSLLEFLGRFGWLLLPLPPLAWLALRPVARRWERCRRDPAFARAEPARRRFRRAAARNEEEAWRHYLADRLGLCAEALTAETVAEALHSRNVDPGLVAETRRRFEERDAADYGRRPAAPPASIHDLVRRLHRATVPLLLLIGVLAVPARGDAGETGDSLFGRALQQREEKPDEAGALFVEAALRFEASGEWLNAGNSWSFAGESGRALACFRAALRRWPFDSQVRESIEVLRANRADAYPVPAAGSGKLAAGWQRFCDWAPVLRLGAFVLVYLTGAAFYVAGRLLGWRVPRAVWSLFVGAAFLPLVSLATTSLQPADGVVIEDSVARLGPGYAYDPAFRQPLHKAAEFGWLEARQGWVRVRLPGAGEGWLRESDCLKVQ